MITNSKFLNVTVKALLLCLLSWALYNQFHQSELSWTQLLEAFQASMQAREHFWLWLTVALVPLNWLLETLKWRQFMNTFLPMPFGRSVKAVLAGVTLSVFTPNRVGDLIGRMLLVDGTYNWKTVLAGVASSLCQLVPLLLLGWLGVCSFGMLHLPMTQRQEVLLVLVGVFGFFILFFSLIFINKLLLSVKKSERLQRIAFVRNHLSVISRFKSRIWCNAIAFAFLRYTVYVLQYYCMLRFVQLDIPFFEALTGIASIYVVQTGIPLPPALGIVARGELALLIWGTLKANALSILVASYGLFILNLDIPALAGIVIILRIKDIKSTLYAYQNAPSRKLVRPDADADGGDFSESNQCEKQP